MAKPASNMVIVTSLAAGLAGLGPMPLAIAQSQPSPRSDLAEAEALAREAIEKMVRALNLAIKGLPLYDLPEINERGDIIIRRLNPAAKPPAEHPPAGRSGN
ncbi:MAG: hypothetical protein ACT4P2_01635 [Pseudomonadota bacterium]